ncbi:MAG TPA: prepilin peptidase [Gaiellaceae bacterium]|nr:prepilin peptidase [Gaiellaceae bacterium]
MIDATTVTPAPLRPARVAPTLLLGASVAALVLARGGLSAWNVVAALAAGVLVWVAAIDLETRLLPNRIILPATVVVLGAAAVVAPARFPEHLLASALAGGFLFVAAAVRPGDLGMGDAKLALLLGALLGGAVLTALLIGFSLVGVAALVLLAREGRPALKRHLPLGPFLAFGAIATVLLVAP